MRDIIREEVTESREREKRRENVIVRGIQFGNDFDTKFRDVCFKILEKDVRLTDPIPIGPNLVRGTIRDSAIRTELITKSPSLENYCFFRHFYKYRFNQEAERGG